MNVLILMVLICHFVCGEKLSLNSMQINITKISQCPSKNGYNYPVSVDNVKIMTVGAKFVVSGSLSTTVDLTKPIQASVKLKRHDILWIPVPCVYNLGSCTYTDLCTFGYPPSSNCPHDFVVNNVPCRCPIPRGNYTINPRIYFLPYTSWLSGNYYALIHVTHNSVILACYEVYFILYEGLINNYDGLSNSLSYFLR